MPRVNLTDKTAIVTGAGRGIGRAVAVAMAARGARVMLNARSYDALRETLRLIGDAGGEADMYAGDLGAPEAMSGLAAFARERFGGLDIVVAAGGMLGPRLPLEDYPVADWQRVLDVNLTGVFTLVQASVPLMRERGGGSIILVSSGVGRVGRAGWGAYAVSKFGIEGLCQILADEGAPHRIRANCVNPGPTRTAMRAAAEPDEDPATLPTPDDIVPVFLYLASDLSADTTGRSMDARDWMGKDL
ncbi:SDR family NAD(P)-dependent oxidoreductase [bacterium]|nr:SDR family NAD(P)-dependent oxidoreductase [bacterium]